MCFQTVLLYWTKARALKDQTIVHSKVYAPFHDSHTIKKATEGSESEWNSSGPLKQQIMQERDLVPHDIESL